jgi:hypothetical protein
MEENGIASIVSMNINYKKSAVMMTCFGAHRF